VSGSYLRVPPRIEYKDITTAHQVQPEPAGLEGHQDHVNFSCSSSCSCSAYLILPSTAPHPLLPFPNTFITPHPPDP
jgi:hypothetical protein